MLGFISSVLGTAGGASGTGYAAPSSANILNPTTTAQANTAYTGNQNALTQQQNFLNAIQAQNGLGNQTSVYNQLQGVANGTGPNPAQAQLAQATGANVANQAALMAGQRGSNANVGLMARQAAQQGASTQQQAAGQAASTQAQQSLGALQNLGSLATTQAQQQAAATSANTGAQQSEQQNLLNSIAQQNNANVGMQSNINSTNAGLAQTTMGQQSNLLGNIVGGIGSTFTTVPSLAKGGEIQHYDTGGYTSTGYQDVTNDPNSPFNQQSSQASPTAPPIPSQSIQAPTKPGPASNVGKQFQPNWNWGNTGANQSNQQQGIGIAGKTIGNAIGSGLKALFGSSAPQAPISVPGSTAADYNALPDTGPTSANYNTAAGYNSLPDVGTEGDENLPDSGQQTMAKGGKVPALVSPGERYLSPKEVSEVAKGKKSPIKAGEKIPGKPKVKGAKNSYKNDTVHRTLEEGGIVLPRSVTQAKDAPKKAAEFVKAILAKNHSLPKKSK